MSRSFTVAEDLPFSDQKRIAVNLLDYAHSPSFQLKVRQQFEGLEKKDMEGLQITSNISELIKREDSTANASPDPDQSRRVIIQVVMKTDSSGVSVSDVSTFVVESLQQEEARLVRALRQQKESPESGGTGTDEGLEQDHEAMPPLDDRDDREERGDYRDDVLRESGVI